MQQRRARVYFAWILSTGLLMAGCSRPEIDTREIIRPVRVMALQSGSGSIEESFPGQVEPRVLADLGFQVGGRLLRRVVDVGDQVRKGQVLASLDPRDLSLAVQAAQASLSAASTEHAQLKTDTERARVLKKQNFISQAELDRREQALEASASRLTQARAQFDVQQNQKQYADLRAPGDGVVAQVHAEAGQVVAPGQPVVQWAGTQAVQVSFSVPEGRVAAIRVGQPARVQLWSGGPMLEARVREISPLADARGRTFRAQLDLDDPDKLARFGMSATVHFSREGQDDSFRLPVSALVAEPGGAFVWVFDEGKGVVNRRPVRPHAVNEDSFLVSEGLRNGELVVTAGTHVLNEGQSVRRFVEPGVASR